MDSVVGSVKVFASSWEDAAALAVATPVLLAVDPAAGLSRGAAGDAAGCVATTELSREATTGSSASARTLCAQPILLVSHCALLDCSLVLPNRPLKNMDATGECRPQCPAQRGVLTRQGFLSTSAPCARLGVCTFTCQNSAEHKLLYEGKLTG